MSDAITVRTRKSTVAQAAARGRPAYPAHTLAHYLVLPSGAVYAWAYLDKASADIIAARLNGERNGTRPLGNGLTWALVESGNFSLTRHAIITPTIVTRT